MGERQVTRWDTYTCDMFPGETPTQIMPPIGYMYNEYMKYRQLTK